MKKIPMALGLYSVRTELSNDWEATLRAVREMGYEGVEFYGPMRYDIKQLKKVLDELGRVDAGKLNAFAFDQMRNGYYAMGEKVGLAWNIGAEYLKD